MTAFAILETLGGPTSTLAPKEAPGRRILDDSELSIETYINVATQTLFSIITFTVSSPSPIVL